MGTLIYTPGIRVHIQTSSDGIVDVSDDLESGSLILREKQPSTFSFSLTNYRRKYDGVFTPNDTISVQMKRLRWMPVFSGYLNQVPYFSIYPRSIQLTATDSLKRLQYRLWDPGTAASVALLSGTTLSDAQSKARTAQADGGLRDILIQLLETVGGWPAANVHVGRIPDDWDKKMSALQAKIGAEINVDPTTLGLAGAIAGVPSGSLGGKTKTAADSNANASGANRIILQSDTPAPDDSAKGVGVIPVSRGIVEDTPTVGTALLTGESYASPSDPYYCAMQFGFGDSASMGANPGPGFSRAEYLAARKWWANQRILITSPKTNRSVVVRAIGWGPGPFADSSMALSPRALQEIGAKEGDVLMAGFAPEGSRTGAVKQEQPKTRLNLFTTQAVPIIPDTVNGASGEGTGERITSDENLQKNVADARAFINANWNIPYGIGGYSPRSASGLSVEADHFRGLALDIFVSQPGTQAVGNDLNKGHAIAEWFANNLVVHQAHYVIWQDLINYGSGWSTYGQPSSTDDTEQHRDHVHVSFHEPISLIAGDPTTYLPDPYDDPSFDGNQ